MGAATVAAAVCIGIAIWIASVVESEPSEAVEWFLFSVSLVAAGIASAITSFAIAPSRAQAAISAVVAPALATAAYFVLAVAAFWVACHDGGCFN